MVGLIFLLMIITFRKATKMIL